MDSLSKNDELSQNFQSMSIKENKNVLQQKLKDLECPFKWQPDSSESDVRGANVLCAIEKKFLGTEGEEISAWVKFVLNLVSCYEKAKQGSMSEAFQKQSECKKILEDCTELPHMPAMGTGLNHVCHACEIYLLFKTEQYEEVFSELRKITFLKDMEPRDQASVWAARGAVYLEYGSKGQNESIKFIERAVALDGDCGEMHFLLGKALSRARRNGLGRVEKPSEKELESFKLAVELKGDAFSRVLLAQSYMDLLMFHEASEIYKKVLEDEITNPYVLARCALGLIKMPKILLDLNLAEKIIRKGLERTSNNAFLNIIAGRLYLKKNQLLEAEKYFSQEAESGNYEAITWLIKTRETKGSYRAASDLERFMKLECYSEIKFQRNLLLLLGLYYYQRQHDFDRALKYWWKVMEMDSLTKFDSLTHLRNPWKNIINVNDVIIRNIDSRMRRNIPYLKKKMYLEVLEKYQESCPELLPDNLQMK